MTTSKTSRRRRALAIAGSCALTLSLAAGGASSTACIGALDPPTLVKTPRILAIMASLPESRPGEDIEIGALAYVPSDPSGASTTYRWRLCMSLPRVLDAAQIPADLPLPDTCETLPSTGPTATIPGERTQALADLLSSLPSGGDFDASFLTNILASAGIPFQVEVDVLDAAGTVLVTGIKTLAITTREEPLPPPTTNPPPVLFTIADGDDTTEDIDVVMPDSIFGPACIVTGTALDVPAESVRTITPIPGTDWTEEFPIYDFSGTIRIGRENEYYSFYATGGSLVDETTRPPDRATEWTTPETPGSVRLWLIVRDGHLGARGCFVDLNVVPSP